jgi:hypothetical protein
LYPEDKTLSGAEVSLFDMPQEITLRHTQPNDEDITPARTAPEARPVVYPALIMPMHNPRRFGEARSTARMIAMLINPPLPIPATARPTRKIVRVGAAAVMNKPIARMVLAKIT